MSQVRRPGPMPVGGDGSLFGALVLFLSIAALFGFVAHAVLRRRMKDTVNEGAASIVVGLTAASVFCYIAWAPLGLTAWAGHIWTAMLIGILSVLIGFIGVIAGFIPAVIVYGILRALRLPQAESAGQVVALLSGALSAVAFVAWSIWMHFR